MQGLRDRLTYSNVMVTVLAVLVLGSGAAYAATKMLPKNSVGTKQIQKEAVTPAKLSRAAKATLRGPKGAAGATGPQGSPGATGPQGSPGLKGEPGTPATALWAVINADGTTASSSGVTGSLQPFGAGTYEVDFNRNVSKCSYSATPWESPYFIIAEPRDAVPDGVYVEIYNPTKVPTSDKFSLAVFC
jgi:hypothetical protein